MSNNNTNNQNYTLCPKCQGSGKISRRITKKVRLRYQKAVEEFEKSTTDTVAPHRPKSHLDSCRNCQGSGLIFSDNPTETNKQSFPHIAIIGGGIGGVALAVACFHRGIPFTLYERDSSFDIRSQGYGLTLQQASKAIEGLGIFHLKNGVISNRHIVHNTDGKVIGEWGMRKWMKADPSKSLKRTNIHISRQSLRRELLEKLGGVTAVKWGHQLVGFKQLENTSIDLSFECNGKIKKANADLVVGCDGIRSSVRKLMFGDTVFPLRYLDCIVILGICPLSAISQIESSLLDLATVFQTANGYERIYIMPYDLDSIMWQLSFPMNEVDARTLSNLGSQALKEEAYRRTQNWHNPIPQILAATLPEHISGYPVYDRDILNLDLMANVGEMTLMGDAAHPMSPFKGQGANQALLDALSLARTIKKECTDFSDWRKYGLRKSVLNKFESEMLNRSSAKVKQSAQAAEFLHSEIVLYESDQPRGNCLNKKN